MRGHRNASDLGFRGKYSDDVATEKATLQYHQSVVSGDRLPGCESRYKQEHIPHSLGLFGASDMLINFPLGSGKPAW